MTLRLLALTFVSAAVFTGCIPDVYLVDRHTVMEMEASGSWPELDRVFYEDVQTAGPVPFINDPESKRKKRVKNVLNGEFSPYALSEQGSTKSAGAASKQ